MVVVKKWIFTNFPTTGLAVRGVVGKPLKQSVFTTTFLEGKVAQSSGSSVMHKRGHNGISVHHSPINLRLKVGCEKTGSPHRQRSWVFCSAAPAAGEGCYYAVDSKLQEFAG
jgi:hypothetical protein